jgi:hypothetical protein
MFQVEFRHAAGPFDNNHIVIRSESRIGGEDVLEQKIEVQVIIGRSKVAPRTSIQDDLTAQGPSRFEENWVHVRVRCEPACLGLSRLRTTDFSPCRASHRVVRHVLSFERRNAISHPV